MGLRRDLGAPSGSVPGGGDSMQAWASEQVTITCVLSAEDIALHNGTFRSVV
jgi:hypothetical protein